MLKITFEIYLEFSVVTSKSMLNWILKNEEKFDFERKFIWEIIFNLLLKIENVEEEEVDVDFKNKILKKNEERTIELKRKFPKLFIQ